MKKNPVIQWILCVAPILGSASTTLAEPCPADALTDATVSEAREESTTVVDARRCDERRISSCRTSCIRTCHRGPNYSACRTRCDRDCRARYCR